MSIAVTQASKLDPTVLVNAFLSAEQLDGSRLCLSAMKVLLFLSENGHIGLTKLGSFNREFVDWAADAFQWPGFTSDELYQYNKVLNEEDVQPLEFLHELLTRARLIRHVKSKAVLTKFGTQHLDDFGRLQVALFDTFFTEFDFAAYERFEICIEAFDPVHCLGVTSNRTGEWIGLPEFTEWCLPVEYLVSKGLATEEFAMFCIYGRILRPLSWLGLVELEEPMRYAPMSTMQLRKTQLFGEFLEFDFAAPGSSTVH